MATLLLVIIYIAFISLGLPDAMLGAGWPVMQKELAVPYGFAGFAQMLISGGTIVSSLFSGPLLRRFGTGKLTAFSVALTAAALFGFALAPSFWWLLPVALPLGLGAGAVDSGLNAYVAHTYESRHMSWLHSFWGIGALAGPFILSRLLSQGFPWRQGYLSVASFQVLLVLVLAVSIPLWKRVSELKNPAKRQVPATEEVSGTSAAAAASDKHLTLFESMKIPGVLQAMLIFLFYCGIEASMGLWGGSFLYKAKGLNPASAATWVSLFYASITAGRFLAGFLTMRITNDGMIAGGAAAILAGVALMLLPLPLPVTLAGYLLVGLGCAPIFPSMLHETPKRFGAEHGQTIMGFQMATAYVGSTFLPPLFGFIAGAERLYLLPFFVLFYALILTFGFKTLQGILKAKPA